MWQTKSVAAMLFGDPALSFRYYIPALPYGLPPAFVTAVNVTFNEIGVDAHQAGATSFKYPTGIEVSNVTLTFSENKDFLVAKSHYTWSQNIVTDDGFFYLPADYWKTLVVLLLDVAYPIVKKTLVYEGCWTTGLPAEGLDSTNSEALHHELTLNCNRMRVI